MVEVVFGDSAAGSLKLAQSYGKGPYRPGAIGVILLREDGREATEAEIEAARREAEAREKAAWESAVPLGGSAADVVSFSLALSVGDIAEAGAGPRRMEALLRLASIYPEGTTPAAAEICENAAANLSKIQDRLRAGERVRIWYSQQSDEMCGLHWLAAQLCARQAPAGQVLLVRLPDWPEGAERYASWGDVAPGEWGRFLALQRQISPAGLAEIARAWAVLQAENAPLRAVVNGGLRSVPEDFYDPWILREIAAQEETFYEGRLIGAVLEKYRLGIGDAWIALRVEAMVRAGKLIAREAAAEGKPAYHRHLQKAAGFAG